MHIESYYEIVAENTRTGDVERRLVQCRQDASNYNREKAIRTFEQLRKAGFDLIEGCHVETRTTALEWLSCGGRSDG